MRGLQDKFDSLVQEGYQATLTWHQGVYNQSCQHITACAMYVMK